VKRRLKLALALAALFPWGLCIAACGVALRTCEGHGPRPADAGLAGLADGFVEE
jgi:hypothetical protein